MPVVTVKRVDGLLDLVRGHLPVEVASGGEFDDWNVVAPALLAIAADLLEAILSAMPPRGRVRAEILARSLAEYVITFAWLAAADKDERVQRLRSVVKDEYTERERAERKLGEQIAGRRDYRHLFDPESDREGGPLPAQLLDAQNRDRLGKLKADPDIAPLPNTFDMAFAADKKWMPEIDFVSRNPFALIYFILFTGPSFMTHPSVSAVARVVVGTPPNLVVGVTEPLGESESPYGQSFLTFVNMLLVASRALGWPDEATVRAVLARE